jgi:cytochrome c oxidase subunit III
MQNDLAMTVTLISGAMLFLTLFMGYAIYRSSAATWPPAGISRVSLDWPLVSTLIILLSSLFCYRGKKAIKNANLEKAKMNVNLTLLFGAGFMISQAFLWSHLKTEGVFVSSGIFASILYGFTWIHAAHVILGLMALVYLRFILKPTTVNLVQKATNVEKFWNFLEIIWIIMFITLFVF